MTESRAFPVAFQDGLQLVNISHSYDGREVVRGIDLEVAPGEMVCLLGPSGCGKTTTLRIAAGLERPHCGIVRLGGQEVSSSRIHVPPEKRNIGFLFQDFALFPHLSVLGNVMFGLRSMSKTAKSETALRALARVTMDAYADAYPHMLSGGQQQRVALARALAPHPHLMLLDEPFSGLDSTLRHQIRDETLHVLKQTGISALMVTHDPEEAMFMADRLAVMKEGRIEQMGAPVDLYYAPVNPFVAGFFGEINRLSGTVIDGMVATPLGSIEANGLENGRMVDVLIRPEALILSPLGGNRPLCTARVIAARLLGRSTLIHLEIAAEDDQPPVHLHSRVFGRFLPAEGEQIEITLNLTHVFVFPQDHKG